MNMPLPPKTALDWLNAPVRRSHCAALLSVLKAQIEVCAFTNPGHHHCLAAMRETPKLEHFHLVYHKSCRRKATGRQMI
jgi:hypothetical protein